MTDEPGIFDVMYSTRAMRRLKPDVVPEELLLKLIDAANQAPSGSNAQTARWLVVREREQVRRIAELNRKAIEAYTASAAHAEFQETNKGSLTPGKIADLVVLGDDVFALPPERIRDVKVDVTIVGGRVVYHRGP